MVLSHVEIRSDEPQDGGKEEGEKHEGRVFTAYVAHFQVSELTSTCTPPPPLALPSSTIPTQTHVHLFARRLAEQLGRDLKRHQLAGRLCDALQFEGSPQ